MVQEFIISTVETDLSTKKIIVTTNNVIDPNSIDNIYIEIKDRNTKELAMYNAEIKGNVLEVTLSEWPLPNSSYVFYLKSLTNVLGETTKSGIRRKIEFKSSITEQIQILSPSMHEALEELNVKFAINNPNGKETLNPNMYAYIEVSSDHLFHNVIKSSKILDLSKDNINFSINKSGQLFLRARLELNEKNELHYSKWTDTISFTLGEGEQNSDSTCKDLPNDYLPDFDDMSPIIDIGPDYEITSNIIQGTTPCNITLIANKPLNEDSFSQSQIIIMNKFGVVKHHSIIDEDKIEIELLEELKPNSKYTLKIIGIENIYGDTYSTDIVFNTQMKPMYCELEAVTSLIGEYKIPDDVILYHIREASKFADYIASLENNFIDEENVPFAATQLVKYYAAHECLLRHTIDLSSSTGLSGTVGNVSFAEKETTKDISKLLNHFCEEKDRWKDNMSGYANEGRARMQTTVRGKYASPALQPLGLSSMLTFGRGDIYGN